MNISDPHSLQVFFWLSAVVLVTLIICTCVVGYRHASARTEVAEASIKVADAEARKAEALARAAESGYQQALIERAGKTHVLDLPPISLTIPQDQVNKLAMDYVRQRIQSLRVKIDT